MTPTDTRPERLKHTNNGKVLYVETLPMQWALDNVPGDCTFETWISLEGRAALVRCRLNNHRKDVTQYPAQDQELPAVYTIGKLHRLFTYDGTAPFSGARDPPGPQLGSAVGVLEGHRALGCTRR